MFLLLSWGLFVSKYDIVVPETLSERPVSQEKATVVANLVYNFSIIDFYDASSSLSSVMTWSSEGNDTKLKGDLGEFGTVGIVIESFFLIFNFLLITLNIGSNFFAFSLSAAIYISSFLSNTLSINVTLYIYNIIPFICAGKLFESLNNLWSIIEIW